MFKGRIRFNRLNLDSSPSTVNQSSTPKDTHPKLLKCRLIRLIIRTTRKRRSKLGVCSFRTTIKIHLLYTLMMVIASWNRHTTLPRCSCKKLSQYQNTTKNT